MHCLQPLSLQGQFGLVLMRLCPYRAETHTAGDKPPPPRTAAGRTGTGRTAASGGSAVEGEPGR